MLFCLDPSKEAHRKKPLEKHRTLTFSNRDFDACLEAIESDEEPNDVLKRTAEQYQQRLGG